MVDKLHIFIRDLLRQDMEQSTLDEIFTMLEPWLKLDQDLSRELSVNIFQGALDTYVKGVRLGVNSKNNFTPGLYMMGAMVPRCCGPGLATETMEQALVLLHNSLLGHPGECVLDTWGGGV